MSTKMCIRDSIQMAAQKIRRDSDLLVVIGIGGSYLGARAVIELLGSPLYNSLAKDSPQIYFAGNNMSSSQLCQLLSLCEGKRVSVNVISKSGTTTEPAIAFRVFREYLEHRYGKQEAQKRISVSYTPLYLTGDTPGGMERFQSKEAKQLKKGDTLLSLIHISIPSNWSVTTERTWETLRWVPIFLIYSPYS